MAQLPDEPREIHPFQISKGGDGHVKDFRPIQRSVDDVDEIEMPADEHVAEAHAATEESELPKESDDSATESADSKESSSPKESNQASSVTRVPTFAERAKSQKTEE